MSSRSTLERHTPDYSDPTNLSSSNMRITGYKLLILVSYIIIVLLNLGTLYQLSEGKSRVRPTERSVEAQEAERTLHSGGETDQTSSPRYITSNNKTGGDKENKNGVKIEISRNNTLYYSALPGTRNSWTLFDIRRGATKKRLEVIGLRLIIVDTIPGDFYLIILFFANTE